MEQRIFDLARSILMRLAAGEYELLVREHHASRLSASEIHAAVADYGRTIAPPPPDWVDYLEIVEVEASDVPKYYVVVPLWTVEEG